MTSSKDWDYALRIRGITPRSIPMSRLADYLKEWANLIGETNGPVFGGIVKGSAILRASVGFDRRLDTRNRIVAANAGIEPSATRAAEVIEKMMARDGARGQIVDREGAVIFEFRRPSAVAVATEYIVSDTGVIDAVVVGIGGVDETVHVRLQEASGAVHSVTVRDMRLARQLALHFRSDVIRVHVHGSWKRDSIGAWSPHSLYADHAEELDQRSANEILDELAAVPGNGWASLEDPDTFWRDIRGTN